MSASTTGGNLLLREVLPFGLAMLGLVGAALACDAALHLAGLVWIGRWLGIPGLALILASVGYSVRKRMRGGAGPGALRRHEWQAWAGSLLVLVHAGVDFEAILAWLAILAMMVNVASGLTGKFLLARARQRLEANRAGMRAQGLTPEALEQRLYWDSMTFDAIRQWRAVHVPITMAFGALALGHIVSTILFWTWP
jgi:hypothetical protein